MNIIIFDGVCKLCNGFVQYIIKKDKNAIFKFATLQAAVAQELLAKQEKDFSQIESVIVIINNTVFVKSKAVFEIAKLLRGYYLLALPFSLLPLVVTDFGYDFVAKHRYKVFGKRDSCMLPSKEIAKRFLD